MSIQQESEKTELTIASRDVSMVEVTQPDTTSALRREVKEFAKLILWFLVLFFVIKTFLVEGYQVQGDSMHPVLENNDRILVFKLPHILSRWVPFIGIQGVKPGDIIVFDSPDDLGKRYVKRLIAQGKSSGSRNTVDARHIDSVPGMDLRPAVRIEKGVVYIDNQRLQEPYISEDCFDDADTFPEIRLNSGEFYVLGDNRLISKDSRRFQAITDDHVVGTAVLRFWPLSRFGSL